MILLCGIPSEEPLALVAEALAAIGAPVVVFSQRRFAESALRFEIRDGAVRGRLDLPSGGVDLERIEGVYTRLMDDRFLPELESEPGEGPLHRSSRALHDALTRWCEVTPCRVVNRAAPMGSNFSKPYQAQLVRAAGFAVPETLVTNDPALVERFVEEHPHGVVYKSVSGVRSIVQRLDEAGVERLDDIRWCPTQFQAYVAGQDVRVHVVGTAAFATSISSDATDYRYATSQVGDAATLRVVEVPDKLGRACVALTQDLGLAFAGIDLRVTPDGDVVCFEVNPSPAFSYYERSTGQPISRAVAEYLAGVSPRTVD